MSVPRFWREIPQRYNLQASKCGVCQAIAFPPRQVCPTCRRASIGLMESMKLSGQGHILEWTRVHKPAPGFAMQVPYIVALIATKEGPIITGQIVEADGANLQSGAAVHAVFRRLGEDGNSGVIYYGTKWRLLGPQSSEPQEAPPAKKRLGLRRKATTKTKKQ